MTSLDAARFADAVVDALERNEAVLRTEVQIWHRLDLLLDGRADRRELYELITCDYRSILVGATTGAVLSAAPEVQSVFAITRARR
ncbi:MAG: hypothetical protein ACXWQ6_02120 [Candidatus Limnocylindrales bacterium]